MFGTLKCWSQEPSFFKLGEKELSGVDIYDLFQDSKHNYWIAGNNGLYKYDGYQFITIPFSTMTSTSVFHLTERKNGQIFCYNLSGQFFRVENDSAKLHFTIPDSLMHPYIDYEFDNKDQLIIFTK